MNLLNKNSTFNNFLKSLLKYQNEKNANFAHKILYRSMLNLLIYKELFLSLKIGCDCVVGLSPIILLRDLGL